MTLSILNTNIVKQTCGFPFHSLIPSLITPVAYSLGTCGLLYLKQKPVKRITTTESTLLSSTYRLI